MLFIHYRRSFDNKRWAGATGFVWMQTSQAHFALLPPKSTFIVFLSLFFPQQTTIHAKLMHRFRMSCEVIIVLLCITYWNNRLCPSATYQGSECMSQQVITVFSTLTCCGSRSGSKCLHLSVELIYHKCKQCRFTSCESQRIMEQIHDRTLAAWPLHNTPGPLLLRQCLANPVLKVVQLDFQE